MPIIGPILPYTDVVQRQKLAEFTIEFLSEYDIGEDELEQVRTAFGALAPHLNNEDAYAMANQLLKAQNRSHKAAMLMLGRLASSVNEGQANEILKSLTNSIVQITDPKGEDRDGLLKAVTDLSVHTPWTQQVVLFVNLLKLPTIYGEGKESIVKAIRSHLDANAIKIGDSEWDMYRWLASQGIDVAGSDGRALRASL